MVHGLDIFRERFQAYPGALVLIGGAACDASFSRCVTALVADTREPWEARSTCPALPSYALPGPDACL